ncbi:MAG: potassium channel family protein [Aliiglaciecola sp.]|uniref:ion channel n=1 Tax=Aliiglaciecola sp. M165 TaxID=2593649 RepID=UPI00117F1AC8|nr:ion channel [Aliiglaciecola sp. M165]TRY33258.1 two pore domain potassium channel family protein [Aliiglaciecola sp. M165]
MWEQLLVGAVVITLTIIVQVVFLGTLASVFGKVKRWVTQGLPLIKNVTIMVIAVLWLVVGITINTWIWAFMFLLIGEFSTMENALYFAITSFTTLGYGDLLLSDQWRILGSLSAVNGLIVFGLNTAFLVELMIATWGRSKRR